MIDSIYVLWGIAAMAAVTFALRALPFVAGKWLNQHPVVRYLGRFLPLAIMALLTVHSMMGKVAQDVRGPWPELAAVALVTLLQWRGRNALVSILLGTGFYVLLIQLGQRSG